MTGKFRDELGVETTANSDAQLNVNSAFDTYRQNLTVERIRPNYVGIAVVAGAAGYFGAVASNSQQVVGVSGPNKPLLMVGDYVVPGFIASSAASNLITKPAELFKPLFNIKSRTSYSSELITEVKTELNFNSLTTD